MLDRDPFDKLEEAAEAVVQHIDKARGRIEYERGNRLGLLWVHAIVALVVGAQMLAYGSSAQIESTVGVWSRGAMGGLGIVGGGALACGLIRRPRSIPAEAVGLAVVGTWDFLMALGFAVARLSQHKFGLIPLDAPLPAGYVTAYPVAVYAGLFALILVHLRTLRFVRHDRKGPHAEHP